MSTISFILNIVLGLLTIYLYLENRRLKGFEIDKEIKIKEIAIQELERQHKEQKAEHDSEMSEREIFGSGIATGIYNNLKAKQENEKNTLLVELEHLKKLKKYRWIFSK